MKTEILKSWDIDSELKLSHVKKFDDSFNDLVRKHFDRSYPILRWRDHLSPSEKQSVKELNDQLNAKKRINVAIFKNEELVGWSYGWQGGFESATYYMANSFVLPEYRRKGFYNLMVKKVIEISESNHFQTITSRHVAANNAVIIAKLKAGFKITGMELSEIHGNLVTLTYFHNELRAECFEVRSGMSKSQNPIISELYK